MIEKESSRFVSRGRRWGSLAAVAALYVVWGCGQAPAPQPAEPVEPAGAPQQEAPPSAPGSAAALMPESLVGSRWEGGPLTLEFRADGVLWMNDAKDGTWKAEGNTVEVSGGGYSYSLEIRGRDLLYGDMPLRQLAAGPQPQ